VIFDIGSRLLFLDQVN